MGRFSLCIFCFTTAASSGDKNALQFIHRRVMKKGHAVVVVAEGYDERIFGSKGNEKDAGGNRQMKAVGVSGGGGCW